MTDERKARRADDTAAERPRDAQLTTQPTMSSGVASARYERIEDEVEKASEESFSASDVPSWSPTYASSRGPDE